MRSETSVMAPVSHDRSRRPRSTDPPSAANRPPVNTRFRQNRAVRRREGATGVERSVLVAGLVLGTLLAGVIGIRISATTSTTASWWPAAGVAVVTLFVAPRAWWPRLLVALYAANLLANVIGGHPWGASACLAAADLVEIVVVCWGTLLLIGRTLEKLSDLARLALISFCGAALAALGVALTSVLLLDGGTFQKVFVSTLGSHWSSVIVIAPLGLLPRQTVRRPSRSLMALHATLLAGVTLFAF